LAQRSYVSETRGLRINNNNPNNNKLRRSCSFTSATEHFGRHQPRQASPSESKPDFHALCWRVAAQNNIK